MGIPERMASIANLCSSLGLTMNDVYLDVQHSKNPLKSSLNAFCLSNDKNVTHRCVLQDDVFVCNGFKFFLNDLVNEYPDDIFSLMVSTSKVKNVPMYSVVKTGGGMWGQGIVIPIKYINLIKDELEKHVNPNYPHDDRWYPYCANKFGWRVLTTVPSSIQTLTTKEGNLSSMGHMGSCKSLEYMNNYSNKFIDKTNLSLGLYRGKV